jgi:hypothetical protein
MSEAEKKRRLYYRQNRSKWLKIGAIILAAVLLVTAVFATVYLILSQNVFVEYTEEGDVKYKVYLKDNDIFGGEYIGEDKMYIASLMDKVALEFRYSMLMAEEAQYSYTYGADANIVIRDTTTKKLIYKGKLSADTPELIPETTVDRDQASQRLLFSKSAEIDYKAYNERAKAIVDALSLSGVTCTLEVEMNISITSSAVTLEEDGKNTYAFSIHMPLNTDKVSFDVMSSVPTGTSKLLAINDGAAKIVFLVLLIVFASLLILYSGAYIVFIYLTRNTDITYAIKVKRVVNNYKSYIQKIINPFEREGYQLLLVDDFTELLEIRDTIQSPILMNENEDRTCTSFMIPTNTKLLYIFEIKVDDYDEIYRKVDEGEETPITTDELPEIEEENEIEDDGANTEEIVLLENVDEEELAVAIELPDVPLSEIDYEEEDDEEEDEGVEVIGVVWPEKSRKSKVYRYDPNGERVTNGDVVLVPSRDVALNKDIIRKATVAHGNHKVDPENIKHPLKKIIGVIRRRAEEALMPNEAQLAEIAQAEAAAIAAAEAASENSEAVSEVSEQEEVNA